MLEKKDYLDFMGTLFQVEKEMEDEVLALLVITHEPRAQELLTKILADERRHQQLVKEMMALVT